MSGTVIITGASGGMARIAAKLYAQQHPKDHLVLLVRNASTIPSGLIPPSDLISYMSFDMSNLASVRETTSSIIERVKSGALPRVKALVCTAAVLLRTAPHPRVTVDGYEETVAVNHLAHLSLILSLLPFLLPDARLVIVGSDSHGGNCKVMPVQAAYRPLRELLEVEPGTDALGKIRNEGMQRYATSKLLQTMTGHELARRLKTKPEYSGITVSMYDPGTINGTGLTSNGSLVAYTVLGLATRFSSLSNWLLPALQIARKEESAAMLVRLVVDEAYVGMEAMGQPEGGAAYYGPNGEAKATGGEANEPDKARELWRDSIEVLGTEKDKALGG